MSVTITVVPNPLAPDRTETATAPALLPWLQERFGKWPATARLYHQVGSAEFDVTPECPEDCVDLAKLTGTFVVRILPAGALRKIPLVGRAIKWITSTVAMVPNIKAPEQRTLSGSPNNELGKRSNRPRPKERIPYILGRVRSVPDLLMVPYTVFVDHVETEICYYCVGVGEHAVTSMRDGSTRITEIERASAQVYLPGKAPTGGPGSHEPDPTWSVGDPIDDDVYTVYQLEAVNGLEVHAFNDFTFYGVAFPGNGTTSLTMVFFDNGDGTGRISVPYASESNEVTDRVSVGDQMFLYWPIAHVPTGGVGTAPDLSTPVTEMTPLEVTSLEVTDIDPDPSQAYVHLTVNIPSAQQAEWALLETYFDDLQDPGNLFPYEGATFEFAQLTSLRNVYVGPFFIDFEHPAGASDFEVVCNFVAPRGLYCDDGTTIRALFVEIQVILTPVDANGLPNGTPEAFQGTLEGSAVSSGQRALTLRCKPVGFGTTTRCLVQARRLTNAPRRQRQTDAVEEGQFGADLDNDPPILAHFSGTVEDEIRWSHCYSMSKPPNISFGNVTTIHTRTVATAGAFREKERELNCVAWRKNQTWDGAVFGGDLELNDLSENLLFTVLKDPTIGNLPDGQIDYTGIAAAFAAVRDSVVGGALEATRLAYTFDDIDLTLEETIQAICQSAFCVPYRIGDTISVRPEIATDDGALVLNHRNVIRDSMVITDTLGRSTEHDSVECSYVEHVTGLQKTVTVPVVGTLLKPRQVRPVGLFSELQAYWHAYRAYMRMLYQRQNVSLEATQEAEILGNMTRVLIADGTRSTTQSGEVIGFDESSTIRTSQPVALQGGKTYTCYLQKSDGTVEEFHVLSAPSTRELELDGTPEPITEPSQGVPTFYILVPDDEPMPRAYLVTGRRSAGNLTNSIDAVNYSHMYYFADGLSAWVDFAHGLLDQSPHRRVFDNTGGVVSGGQWQGENGDSFETTIDGATASYTNILFITADSAPTHSGLIQSGNDNSEEFAITVGDQLVAGHSGTPSVLADYSTFTGAEHMVALTYDAVTDRMALFIDGVLVDEATVSDSALTGETRYLEDYEGSCRWLARWHRALSDREIMEVYLRNRQT